MGTTFRLMRLWRTSRVLVKVLGAGVVSSFIMWSMAAAHAEDGPEPSYNGQSLRYWLDDYGAASYLLSSQHLLPLTEEQTNAVLHMGTNAIPWLVKRSARPDQFSDRGTIEAFRILGPLARSAIPDLFRLVTNQPECFSSGSDVLISGDVPMLALGGIGKDAVPALVEILTNSISPGRRFGALEAIASIGTNALPALPVLMRFVNDTNDMVAWESVDTIGAVGVRQPAGIQALEQIMQVGNVPHRQLRSEALSAFRYYGEDCAPAVIPALDDRDDYSIAFTTLVAAAPHALTNAAVLHSAVTGLRSRDFDHQDWAAQVLRAAGQQARGQRPDYEVPGGDMNAIYREATNALSQLSPDLYNEYIGAGVPFHGGNSN